MGEWHTYQLRDLADDFAMGPFGSNIKADNFSDKGVPVIKGQNLNFNRYVGGSFDCLTESKADELYRSNCFPDDLVLTHRGTIGQVGLVPHGEHVRYVVSQSGMKVTVNKSKILPLFLFYFLKSDIGQFELLKNESQVGVPSISSPLTSLKSIEITAPDVDEQGAIVEVLGSIDDKIDLLNRQNKTLESLAETLFRHWFIDGAQDDWENGVLSDEFDFVMGLSPPGSSYNESGDGMPMYQGNTDFGFRFPARRVFTTEPKRIANRYDTLISVRAPVGEQNMAGETCCIGRGVAAFRYKRKPELYSYTYFKMRSLMTAIRQFNDTGTVFGSVSKGDFDALKTEIPPIEYVEQFQSTVKDLDDKVILNCEQIANSEALRDALLPNLMSGKIRVEYEVAA